MLPQTYIGKIFFTNIHLALNLSISIISHFLAFLNVASGIFIINYKKYANGNYTSIQPKYHCPSHRVSTSRVSSSGIEEDYNSVLFHTISGSKPM